MGRSLPDALAAELRDAWLRQSEIAQAVPMELPETLPLVPMRGAMLVPHSIAPVHVGRASTFAAIAAARRSMPALVAVFSQRAAQTEAIQSTDAVHPVGCLAVVLADVPDADQLSFVVLQAIRWVSLASLEPARDGSACAIAHVAPVHIDAVSDAAEIPALLSALKERARLLASGLPDGERAVALVDGISEPERLVDLVMANLVCSVDEKARYAAAPRLVDKLRIATALCDELRSEIERS